MANIQIKRVYEEPDRDDGTRILVDRLWPRGLTKEDARVDLWLKDVAPSTALRKWFAHCRAALKSRIASPYFSTIIRDLTAVSLHFNRGLVYLNRGQSYD